MNLFKKYTKTSGPFKGWHYCNAVMHEPSCHYINNNGTFATDQRAIGHARFVELKIEYEGQGQFVLIQTDGYRLAIVKMGDLNQVLYAAQEIIDHWNDEIVTDYKDGWLVTNKKETK